MNLEDLYRLLRGSHVQAQGIIDSLEEPLLVLDQTGSVLNGNRAFFEKFVLDRDDTIGRSLFALGTHQWDIPELRGLLGDIIPKSVAIYRIRGDSRISSYWPAHDAGECAPAWSIQTITAQAS
jgi:PAS domain-containing protein